MATGWFRGWARAPMIRHTAQTRSAPEAGSHWAMRRSLTASGAAATVPSRVEVKASFLAHSLQRNRFDEGRLSHLSFPGPPSITTAAPHRGQCGLGPRGSVNPRARVSRASLSEANTKEAQLQTMRALSSDRWESGGR